MALSHSLERTLQKVDPMPLYAAVGAGDLLAEKLRDAREELQGHRTGLNVDPRTLPATLQAAAAARVGAVTAEVKARTSDAKSLPDQATILLTDAVAQAIMTYAGLAQRGRDVVARVRGQEETPDLPSHPPTGDTPEPSATTARKPTTASRPQPTARKPTTAPRPQPTKTASRTTRTAKKSTDPTTNPVKSTSTRGRKSAKSAPKASKKVADSGS